MHDDPVPDTTGGDGSQPSNTRDILIQKHPPGKPAHPDYLLDTPGTVNPII